MATASQYISSLNNRPQLDQYRATSIAGNAVWGSCYYSSVLLQRRSSIRPGLTHQSFDPFSLPALTAVADIYSPICVLVSCSILFVLKPILLELGSAMRIDGASYTYLLNSTMKSLALVAAGVTTLDA